MIDVRIKNNLETWKKNLLDITLRNQSINFRSRKSSTIHVIFPSLEYFLDTMVSSRGVSFAELFNDEEEDEEANEMLETEDEEDFITLYGIRLPKKEMYSSSELLPVIQEYITRKKGKLLFSNVNNKNQRKALRNLMKKSRTFKEENAINVLYFSVGYLEWYESKESNISHKAPLMFISAELNQESFDAPFKVTFPEGDLLQNDSLIQKMIRDFSMDLSTENNQSEDQLSEIYNQYKRFVIEKCPDKRWKVIDDVDLGIFSFSKINMVKDIEENENIISSNLLVQKISGVFDEYSEEPVFEEDMIDSLIKPTEYFHILDADSSQEIAIQSAIAGKSFVLQGPPGTGKSQTITNIITELIARNKKVLFVAEKKAALDVVYNNLRKIRLNDYALPIHNSKLDKKEVIRELANTLSKGQSQERIPDDFSSQQVTKFADARNRLINYREELLKIRYPINKSLYQLYGVFLKYKNQIDLKFDINEYDLISEDVLLEFESLINAFYNANIAINFSEKEHPWYGIIHSHLSLTEKERLFGHITDTIDDINKIKDMFSTMDFIRVDFSLSPFKLIITSIKQTLEHLLKLKRIDKNIIQDTRLKEDIESYTQLVDLFNKEQDLVRQVSANYDMKVLTLSIDRYYRIVKANSSFLKRLFSKDYRIVRNDVLLYKNINKIKFNTLLSDLSKMNDLLETKQQYSAVADTTLFRVDFKSKNAIEKALYDLSWYNEFVSIKKDSTISMINGDFKALTQFLSHFSVWKTKINDFVSLIDQIIRKLELLQKHFVPEKTLFSKMTIYILLDNLKRKTDSLPSIENLLVYNYTLKNASKKGLDQFCKLIIAENIKEKYFDIFLRRFYILLIDKYLSEILPGFDGTAFDLIRKNFANAELTMQQMAQKIVERNINDNIPNLNGLEGFNIEVAILRSEANKSRRIMPFRLLFNKIPNLITKLKPCLMMSPLSVSTFLRKSNIRFDTVIFDEASQVKPENAIGAISRGNQYIISGDKEQLPPTSFFQNIDDENTNIEESYDTSAFDSILEVSTGFMNSIKLRWHYRSKFEELIRPSNKAIYNDLITFPSQKKPNQYEAIQLVHVKGIYVNRQNVTEANKVIELLNDLIERNQSRQSIGVVTFNSEQQTLVERKVNHFRRTHPQYEDFFTNQETEPFFIKNIESVQGDERDIIIISVGYGPDNQGKISMNFGPLNQSNGYRRLNVAVTRAKSCLYLVTSMSAADIDLNRAKSRGVAFLKHYLEFAEFGEDEKADVVDELAKFDSLFEADVYNALVEMGYSVKKKLGCSGYRIDLAIVNPHNPDEFLVGIECDGATYHSSKSVRDRDRLRQQVLEDRNWTIYRIWSTDWIKNRSYQIEKLNKFITNITLSKKVRNSGETPVIPTFIVPKEDLEIDFIEYPNYKSIVQVYFKSYNKSYLPSVIRDIIYRTSPIHMSELKRIVPPFFKRQKYTSVVDAEFCSILRGLNRLGQIKKEREFYLRPDKPISFRKTTENSTRRKFSNIHDDEIVDGIMKILEITKSIKLDDLVTMITKLCGFSSVSGNIRSTIVSILTDLNKQKKLYFDSEIVMTINSR